VLGRWNGRRKRGQKIRGLVSNLFSPSVWEISNSTPESSSSPLNSFCDNAQDASISTGCNGWVFVSMSMPPIPSFIGRRNQMATRMDTAYSTVMFARPSVQRAILALRRAFRNFIPDWSDTTQVAHTAQDHHLSGRCYVWSEIIDFEENSHPISTDSYCLIHPLSNLPHQTNCPLKAVDNQSTSTYVSSASDMLSSITIS
jgi:hypothetical protein